MLSDYDKAHIGEIMADDGKEYSNFSAMLLRLIAKADAENTAKLRRVYPEHVEAYEFWYYNVRVMEHGW